MVEGAPHYTGGHVRSPEHFTIGRDGLIRAHRGKVGAYRVLGQRRATGEVQDGHVVAERLRQSTHRVFRARTALGNHDAKLLPVVHPAVAVGSHERPALLPEHDRPNALLSDSLNEIIGRETCHPLDAFRF